MTHDLKSWPVNFRELRAGRLIEVRRNDRNYALGDTVHVREYLPDAGQFTGQALDYKIAEVQQFRLPADTGAGTSHVILRLWPIVAAPAAPEPPAPPPRGETPAVELWAYVVGQNPVMQIVEDERGERHQIFGRGIDAEARPAMAGRYRRYSGGYQEFRLSSCAHVFTRGLSCDECGMPMSIAGNGVVGKTTPAR